MSENREVVPIDSIGTLGDLRGPYDLRRQPQRRRWLKRDVNISI